MRVYTLFTATVCLAVASAAAVKQSTQIAANPVNQNIIGLEKTGRPYFPEPKYFKESRKQAHYDTRFGKGPLRELEQREAIRILVQTYLSTFRDLGVQTWLMRSTLLSWWWGKQFMPWALDAEFQVMEPDMFFLAAYHNMTVRYFKYGDMEKGKYFQLEINPSYKYRGQDDANNAIDARWIDMETGLFIDITTARYNPNHPEGEGMLYDKHGHEYKDTLIFPLRDTIFEGFTAKVPFRYKQMLVAEYGMNALTNTKYHSHDFDKKLRKWVPNMDA